VKGNHGEKKKKVQKNRSAAVELDEVVRKENDATYMRFKIRPMS